MTLKIKICGLSTLEHIDMVIKSRADMAGFIFANPSPREINPSIAKELSFATAAKSLDRVAVFVDASNAFIEEAIILLMLLLYSFMVMKQLKDV